VAVAFRMPPEGGSSTICRLFGERGSRRGKCGCRILGLEGGVGEFEVVDGIFGGLLKGWERAYG
jgi:hypothetical protein